jgi:hypothetical protein
VSPRSPLTPVRRIGGGDARDDSVFASLSQRRC